MLRGRGLRWSGHAITTGRRRLSPQAHSSRQFASATPRSKLQPTFLASKAPLQAHRATWQAHSTRILSPVLATTGLRFASSTPAGTPQLSTSEFSADASDIYQITTGDLATIPEGIGYLKTLGLDYGWGPTAFVEFLLEHIHIYTGTPWWASILLTSVAIRLALFKPYVAATDVSARLAAIQPITTPIRNKMMAAQRAGNQDGMLTARQELIAIHKKANIQTYKAFVPLVQVFLGFGTFRLFRGMAALPVPALETGGLLWLTDLTVSDPYYVLPIATTAAFYMVMRKGGETGAMVISARMQMFMKYGLPTLSGLFMLAWPGAMQLSLFATSIMSLVQASLFRNTQFRQWLGIYQLPPNPVTPAPGGTETPKSSYGGTITMYQPPDPAAPEVAEKKGMLHGAISEIKGMRTEALKSMKKVVGTTNETGGRRKRTAGELKSARAYEERRRREIAQEKIERGLARSRANRSKMMKDRASGEE